MKNKMLPVFGAILGDIIGSPYEFGNKREIAYSKKYPLFIKGSTWTDDTVMTIAMLTGCLSGYMNWLDTAYHCAKAARVWGRMYPNAGYGARFYNWLMSDSDEPYGSYGNGSAMRVSPVAVFYNTPTNVFDFARSTAIFSHNHPEGVKGAQAVALCINMAKYKLPKEQIKNDIIEMFHYDLNRKLDDIRINYKHDESCQRSVPEAIIAFLESDSFESAVRNAISLSGDADTQADIAGAIAAAYYGIPDELIVEMKKRLTKEMNSLLNDVEIIVNDEAKLKSYENDPYIRGLANIRGFTMKGESVCFR